MAQHTDHEQPDEELEETTGGKTEAPTAEKRIQELETEVEALREQGKRAQADYQNLRRRSRIEHEVGLKRTLEPLLHELFLVLDYLELALASPATTEETRNLATGVEMTRVKLLQALESVDVHPVPSEGIFDPLLHDAAETRTEPGAKPGTILETTRKGYTWKEQVLRPAQVVVAAAPEPDEDEGGDA